MNRTIKFRVWDVGRSRMWYPYNADDECFLSFFHKGTIGWGLYEAGTEARLVTGDPDAILNATGVLMQWSGFTDTKGEEIYEGDLIKYFFENGETEILPVSFKDGCFITGIHDDELLAEDLDPRYNFQILVIGNIHKNPELLKP